jgi:murein DD-endopeptidase MepM/ murein hydrolase activator NlpD
MLAAPVVLGGCQLPSHGVSQPYIAGAPATRVVMPPGALSIQQQFSPGHHLGIDVVGPAGTPVLAAAPGRVTASWSDPAYGERIAIDHGPGPGGAPLRTHYMHLERRDVQVGAQVARGQAIGTLGMSGALAILLPHLHFEVHRPAPWGRFVATDPQLAWLGGAGQVSCLSRLNRTAPATAGLTYPTACRRPQTATNPLLSGE